MLLVFTQKDLEMRCLKGLKSKRLLHKGQKNLEVGTLNNS